MATQNIPLLVSTGWLADRLDDPKLRIYDCSMTQVPDPVTTYRICNLREVWSKGHIPGAGYIDQHEDLSDTGARWRFTLKDADGLATALGRLGISNDTPVVLYSTSNASWSTRAWWCLRTAGCRHVAVLDGGMPKWMAEGRAVSTAPCTYPSTIFNPDYQRQLICDRESVLAATSDPSKVIVDALTAEQHAGTGGLQYARPGHIRGARNMPWRDLTNPVTGEFLDAATIRSKLGAAGITGDREAIVYCGGGIAAAATYFAMALAGYPRLRLYDNSLQEWSADPALPMETG